MKRFLFLSLLLAAGLFFSGASYFEVNPYRVYPYLQVYDQGKIQLTWFGNTLASSEIIIKNPSGEVIFSKNVNGEEVPEIFYTDAEKNQTISGLEKGSWLQSDQAFRYQVQMTLPPGINVSYRVSLGGSVFESSFKTPKSKTDWDKIRFVALADSETEPRGRVTNREWYPGMPLIRPFAIPQLWKDKFGFTTLEGFEIPNYMLTEQKGYAENLKIINSRDIDFMVMPGDLVQGGGYQPGWDEFFRHNAGEFDKGFSTYPVIPSFGNWENFGAINGGYGDMPGGQFAPVVARNRYQAYFKTPVSDPLQKHGQSYYRSDYGPITILTVDSSNGTPDQLASDFDGVTKLKGKEFTVPGTDTQENYTEATYKARGGNDLSSFGPGSDQYAWLEANLKDAKESGQLIFIQYHHIAFSSGEHGVPLNHELSVGQVGTPMQILNPLFEEYEVVAVFSGHDEIFERSFVDQDNDGKGVVYYDVGVAGDGIRAVKRDWKNNPLNTLDYNPYSKWTADQNSVEQWNTSGSNPILTDGGKHYGHLEVNVVKVMQDGKPFARIDFTPVYAFPVLDQNYNLQRVERRVYPDETSLLVALNQAEFVPVVKDSVSLFLDEGGNAVLTPEDFLEEQPVDPFTYTSSVGFDFSCSNIGENEVIITSKNTQTGEEWTESTKVWVFDKIPPYFDAGNATLLFDPVAGKVSFDLIDFYVVDFRDNCSEVLGFNLSRNEVTCADIYQDPNAPVWEFPVEITATDQSGNTSSKTVNVTIGNIIESKKVSITSTGPLEEGGTTNLVLGDELDYTVLGWEPVFKIVSQSGNEATISEPGYYRARLMLSAGCPVFTEQFVFGELTEDYNQDIVLYLDESGVAELSPEDVLISDNPEILSNLILSQSKFTCEDLGSNDVKVTQGQLIDDPTNPGRFEDWIKVIVKDELPPVLTTKIPSLSFDLVKGELELNPEDFVESLTDNCGLSDLYLNKTNVTCSDYDSPIELILTATDNSGNITSESITINVTPFESQKISINPSGNFQGFIGEPIEIKLGDEFGFNLESWLKDGVPIEGANEKAILVTDPGTYWAKIIPDGGCSVLTEKVTITFSDLPFGEVKEFVELPLDESGKASLKPENVFISWPPADPNLDIKLSQSEFACSDIGEKQITITIKNLSGQTWEEKTIVKVQDNLKPVLTPKAFNADFDVTVGSLVLKPEDFIAELTDNCGVKEVTIDKTTATCDDLGKEIPISIKALDASGNVVEAVAILTLNRIETQKVSISGDSEFCEGSKGLLTLNSEAQFEVIKWRRNGLEIVGAKEKTLEIEVGGSYDAVIRYSGACVSETNSFVVEINALPTGEISREDKLLTAPTANSYQWYRNGEKISDAITKTYQVTQEGEYTVEITNAAGCKAKLGSVTFTADDFNQTVFPPIKSSVILELNQEGNATLKAENLFETWPLSDPSITVSIAKTDFSCVNLGENSVKVTLTDSKNQTNAKDVLVIVKDNLPPVFNSKSIELELDISIGKFELNPQLFYTDLIDNCGVKEISINRMSITCEDLGKVIPIEVRVVDNSGNVTEKISQLTVKAKNSAPVVISGPVEFCAGSASELTLNSTAAFEVLRWRRNGVEIVGQNGKVLTIEVGGIYDAVIRYQGACLAETAKYEVKVNPIPTGEIKPDGNKLVAPEGDFTYQWYLNEAPIPSATGRILTLFEMGIYTVELTNSSGCKAKLLPVEVTIAGILRQNPILSEELKIYPNPADDQVELEIKSDQSIDVKSLKIYSMEGKEVTSTVMISKSLNKNFQLDISGIAAGTYMVMLEGEDRKVFIRRFIKR
ncbi:T9SS type A sorting domain-containing protein [Algoriphagus marinus]|uniref:T9SS type A sorting domain-containing protein n=1 Tax=Algoriphagus marinus TaxID=1925762 RepID=UPI00094BC60E|nr:T9SS type A sorting domain-containing protein [Algoriphagus marinus]